MNNANTHDNAQRMTAITLIARTKALDLARWHADEVGVSLLEAITTVADNGEDVIWDAIEATGLMAGMHDDDDLADAIADAISDGIGEALTLVEGQAAHEAQMLEFADAHWSVVEYEDADGNASADATLPWNTAYRTTMAAMDAVSEAAREIVEAGIEDGVWLDGEPVDEDRLIDLAAIEWQDIGAGRWVGVNANIDRTWFLTATVIA